MFTNMVPNLGKVMSRYGFLFVQGLGYTLLLSLLTVLGGTVFGSLLALMRRSRHALVRALATAYVEVFDPEDIGKFVITRAISSGDEMTLPESGVIIDQKLSELLKFVNANLLDIHQTAIILNNEAWTENKMILTEEQQQELKAQAEALLAQL